MHRTPSPIRTGILLLLLAHPAWAAEPAEQSYDGLQRLEGTKMAQVFVNPDADFTRYKRMIILDPYVAFVKDWKREHRRASSEDMERIKRRLSDLFRNVFTEVLEEGGYPVVTTADEDVMVLRPAIIDLNVIAPDLHGPDRIRTFTTNAGAMTLYLEFFDSTTGAILARAIDRKKSRDTGQFQLGSSVYNSSEARKALKYWAGLLRDRLNEIHSGTVTGTN